MYTVLPDGSDGSTAIARMPPELLLLFCEAGPTGVQAVLDNSVLALLGSVLKMRKLTWAWSAAGSPRSEIGSTRIICSAQFFSMTGVVVERLIMVRVYVPVLPAMPDM